MGGEGGSRSAQQWSGYINQKTDKQYEILPVQQMTLATCLDRTTADTILLKGGIFARTLKNCTLPGP